MKSRILFVDDDRAFLDVMRDMLRDQRGEWDLRFASSADEALAAAREVSFDVIVLDIVMPGKDGFWLLSALHESKNTENVPVIMVTGGCGDDLKRRALNLGATDLLNKPVRREDLLARLHSVLRLTSYQDALEARSESLSKARCELEARVEERTASLVAANRRLESEIADRKRGEERIAHLNAVLRAIRNINQLITHETDRSRLLEQSCEILVQTRGYHNAWTALLDGSGRFVPVGEAGLGQGGPPLCDRLEHGRGTRCSRRALASEGVVVTEDPLTTCAACPVKSDHACNGGLAIRLEHAGEVYGVLCVSLPTAMALDAEEQSLFAQVAGDIASALYFLERETARKEAEQRLRQAHADVELVLASILSILIGVDEKGTIVQWNDVAERTFGISAADAVGRRFSECGIEWQPGRVQEAVAACRSSGDPLRVDDIRFTRQDGKDGFLGLTISPMRREGWEQPGFLLVGRDITDRKILESQLTQAQKLEAIGQLAAGIAHEINTPTQYVGDNTRFLQDAFDDICRVLHECDRLVAAAKAGTASPEMAAKVEAAAEDAELAYLEEEVPKAIRESLEGVERVTKIVRAMKEFSHPGAEKTRADINKVIQSTITVARNEWKYVADMVTDLDPDLPTVPCIPGDFSQVVLNMIINAAHAIADVVGDGSQGKGTITISTRRDGDWIEIRVRDTGTGIPEAIRSKILDPFFTTKEVGKGTGQGLAISRSVVVDKHGGTIDFETEVGVGTTFIVRVPAGSELS